MHRAMERIGQTARVTMFQPRGFGPSEPTGEAVTVEQQADDIIAVMDAVGIRRACLAGGMSTGWGAALAAARWPDRVATLVLANTPAQGARSAPLSELRGWSGEELRSFNEKMEEVISHWGEGLAAELWDAELATPYTRRLTAMLERCSATPSMIRSYGDCLLGYDAREIFQAVRVPTWVLRVPGNAITEAAVRYAAELIPSATFHELPSTPAGASLGESLIPMLDFISEVAIGAPLADDIDRFLGTVLFTDICSSTDLLAQIGDARYAELRATHERQVRLEVGSNGGELVNVIGDGTFSMFDGPAKAVRSAQRICEGAATLGIQVRAGLHAGEVERTGGDYAGMTVHIGARVGASAGPGEVLVSRTVRDLVMFSGLSFISRGEKQLKGVPGTWGLYVLDTQGEESTTVAIEPSMEKPLDRLSLQVSRRAPALGRAALKVGNHWQRRSIAKIR
jgi:class 3 adenylate cyclase/pimeloyl-ACP methyl ester carboxylesterase